MVQLSYMTLTQFVRRGILAFIACTFLIVSVNAAPATNPYEIPAILSLTGSAAFVGTAESQTLDAFAAEINAHGGVRGTQIKFVVSDDGSNPQVAVQLANEVIAKHFPLLVGPGLAASCAAVAPLMASGATVSYCLSPAPDPAHNGFVFSSSASTSALVGGLVRYFRERGIKRIGIITSNDASGQVIDLAINSVMTQPENKAAGLHISGPEHFNPTDISVSAQMSRLKADNVDAIIAWANGTSTGTLLHGYNDTGFAIPLALGTGNMVLSQLQQYRTFATKEVYFASVPSVAKIAPSKAVRAAQDTYFHALSSAHIPADAPPTYAWDPLLIITTALQNLGLEGKPIEIQRFIESMHGFAGINGVYDFRDGSNRGLSADNVIVSRWDSANNTFIGVSGNSRAHR